MLDQQLASMIASIVEQKLANLNSASNSLSSSTSGIVKPSAQQSAQQHLPGVTSLTPDPSLPPVCNGRQQQRYKPHTRSLSPTSLQWQTTTDSVLCGFLTVLLSARFESRYTGRHSPPAHQLPSPFYHQPSLQQLHRSHNKR